METITVSKEHPPRDAGITPVADIAANQPVHTSESDTGDGKEPETKEEQQEGSGEEEPVQSEQTRVEELEQQPPRPEADKEIDT